MRSQLQYSAADPGIQVGLRIPTSLKEVSQQLAQDNGESLNSYLNKAIREFVDKELRKKNGKQK